MTDDHLRLGIDIGGTGIKCALVDLRDGSMASERFRLDTPHPATPDAVAGTIGTLMKDVDYRGPAGVTFLAAGYDSLDCAIHFQVHAVEPEAIDVDWLCWLCSASPPR